MVHDLKLLQAFFAELENTGEIDRSPFPRISMEKRRHMMHVMYDAPIYLRADVLKQVMAADVPQELQWVKDLFVLNCAIGCRISDLLRLTMDTLETDVMAPNLKYGKQRYIMALKQLLKLCGITRPVSIYNHELGDNVYKPLYEVATSKLARKTHIDMLNKVQINYYAAGLHRAGSDAVFRYTNLELVDRYRLLKAAFGL